MGLTVVYAALLDKINKDPDDPFPVLVLADWHEENMQGDSVARGLRWLMRRNKRPHRMELGLQLVAWRWYRADRRAAECEENQLPMIPATGRGETWDHIESFRKYHGSAAEAYLAAAKDLCKSHNSYLFEPGEW